ncbi:ankyrin repeat domain-containing protein [Actinoallomurus liliacearum]
MLEAMDDSDLVGFATRLFGLARTGQAAALAAYVDAGVPADLTNDKGDSLLMLAAYHGHADTNDRGQTPDAGADPTAGNPSAVEAARMFGHDDLLAWFEG